MVKKVTLIGVIAAILIVIIDLLFFSKDKIFAFLLGIAFVVGVAPFMLALLREGKREEEISGRFLEFSRNLAESVTTGTPISKSIINISSRNYGALNPHIKKLANQIRLGIPVKTALQTFAEDVNNKVIKRAIALMMEAEKAGGELDYILASVANSIANVEKLKKERRAAMFNLIVQGYIIFFIFIGIMLVMEFKILPLTYGGETTGGIFGGTDISGVGIGAGAGAASERLSAGEISGMFLYLLLTQGLFAGLVIGKLSEGRLKSGIKHSFVLTIVAFLVSTGARALAG